MYYDATGGQYFSDNVSWRKKWKNIENRGNFIFTQEVNTQNEIRALIKSLHDQYSVYKSPEEFVGPTLPTSKSLQQDQLQANIGIEIRGKTSDDNQNKFLGVEVAAVYPDSSGERSGLRVGDLIVEIGKRKLKDIHTYPQSEFVIAGLPPVTTPSTSWMSWILSSASAAAMTSNNVAAISEEVSLRKTAQEVFEERVRHLLEGEQGTSIRLGIIPRASSFSVLHSSKMSAITTSSRPEDFDSSMVMEEEDGGINSRSAYSNRLYHVSMTRDHIPRPTLQSTVTVQEMTHPLLASGSKIAYIRMKSFSPSTTASLLHTLRSSPAVRDASMLLLDLRNNFGGVMQDALFDASLFLHDPDTVLCYTITPRGTSTRDVGEWEGDPRSPTGIVPSTLPVGILVNEGSASASELFASALRDNGRAVIVGTRTYGKGLIQHLFPLPDGGVMKLTVGEYLTPKKAHIVRNLGLTSASGGILPDVLCSDQPSVSVDSDQCVRSAIDALL